MAKKLMLKNKPNFNEYLKESYVNKKMTMAEIAKEIGCSPPTILNHLRRLNIDTRTKYNGREKWKMTKEHKKAISKAHKGKIVSKETRRKISKAKKGMTSPNWNGGKRHRPDGYIQIYKPDHPYSSKEGYVMEHRLVMEKKLGRYLKPKEVVHHINQKRDDNRIKNLELFGSVGEHTSFHQQRRKENC